MKLYKIIAPFELGFMTGWRRDGGDKLTIKGMHDEKLTTGHSSGGRNMHSLFKILSSTPQPLLEDP